MATRGTIALEREDGSIAVVYSHWDNYPQYNGKLLFEHYNTKEEVEKLIEGGAISSLGSYVADEPRSFTRPDNFDNYTVFYSYRGEKVPTAIWGSLDDYERNQLFEEVNYIFTKDGVWSYMDLDDDWKDLEEELIKQNFIAG